MDINTFGSIGQVGFKPEDCRVQKTKEAQFFQHGVVIKGVQGHRKV